MSFLHKSPVPTPQEVAQETILIEKMVRLLEELTPPSFIHQAFTEHRQHPRHHKPLGMRSDKSFALKQLQV